MKIALSESVNPRWDDLSEHWGQRFAVAGQSMKDIDRADAQKIRLGTKRQAGLSDQH